MLENTVTNDYGERELSRYDLSKLREECVKAYAAEHPWETITDDDLNYIRHQIGAIDFVISTAYGVSMNQVKYKFAKINKKAAERRQEYLRKYVYTD